jgi:hypothetical protein
VPESPLFLCIFLTLIHDSGALKTRVRWQSKSRPKRWLEALARKRVMEFKPVTAPARTNSLR